MHLDVEGSAPDAVTRPTHPAVTGLTVVTGATGHIGNNLVRHLVAAGRRVRCLVLPGDDLQPLAGLPVEVRWGDVRDPVALREAFAGAALVYHLASMVSIDPSDSPALEEVNVRGARRVAEACLACGVERLVHTSSIHALAEPRPGVEIDEEQAFDPAAIDTVYGRSKARGTREVLAAVERGLDAVVVCPTGVIGPHDYRPSPMGQLILDFARRRLPAYVDGAYDFVDVRDVAAGMAAAAARGRAGRSYILSGQRLAVRQILAILAELTGAPVPRLRIPRWCAYPAAGLLTLYGRLAGTRPLLTRDSVYTLGSNSHISHARAARELGFRPHPVRGAIADAVAWFRERELPVRA
ncbi:MAG TPA: SDR family oxidoreductase [Bacillota bacterium]|nr:SDR family oxidoreductase [Bacillota bacterium]